MPARDPTSRCSCPALRSNTTRRPRVKPHKTRVRTAVCWRPQLTRRTTVLHRRRCGERPLAGAVALCSVWSDHNQRGMARVRSKLECCASYPETASAVARARACHAKSRLRKVEAAAGMSHHGLAPKERSRSPVQCPSIARKVTTTRAARRARTASSRATPPPERESERSSAPARATRKPAAQRGGRSWHVAPRSWTEGVMGIMGQWAVRTPARMAQSAQKRRFPALQVLW